MSTCKFKKPTVNNCVDCMAEHKMPFMWCCLKECGEHNKCEKCHIWKKENEDAKQE